MKMMMFRLVVPLLVSAAVAAQPLVVGHRGCRALRSENTLAAFEHAVSLGVDVVELDTVVTADDRILVNHDVSVNTRNCFIPGAPAPAGPLYIRLLRFAETQRFDCGSRKNPAYPRQQPVPGARMPALEEVFDHLRNAKAELMIETKMARDGNPHCVEPRHFVALLNALIERHGFADRVILQSSDHRTLREMRRLNPRVRLCPLNPRERLPDYVAAAKELGAEFQYINWAIIKPGDVSRLHANGIKVFSGTTDDPAIWRRLAEMKVDGILTDDPAGLIELLR